MPDGTLFASEHRNSANDEINRIEAGQNYGWPIIEGYEEQDGMVSPLFTSGDESTWAPSGMGYHNGKLYVSALRGTAVLEFDLETGEYREVITDLGRIRHVLIEGGNLFFISNNSDGRGNPQKNDDKLYRISLSKN
ncbi:PQQ-dependent sugar dehydrogenase [Caldifermentibacillus hisashii]